MIKKYFRRRETTPDSPPPPVFLENTADDFFFSTPVLIQRLDLLRHLVQSGGFFLILVGEQGTGKNTLLKRLCIPANPRWEVCRVPAVEFSIVGPSADDETQPKPGLLERLIEEYKLTPPSQDSDLMKNALFDHIGALHDSGGIPLVIVDGNETPPVDDLRLLAELSSANERLGARIVLICKPGNARRIRELVATFQGGEITHTVDVPPFTEEEVGDYLHLRWNQTNPVGDDPFTDGVIRSIYHASKGLPASVNELARQFVQNRLPASSRKTRVATIGAPVLDTMTQRGGLIALVGGLIVISVSLLLVMNHKPQGGTERVDLPLPIPPTNTQQAVDLKSASALGGIALGQPPLSALAGSTLQRPVMPLEEFKSAIAPQPLTPDSTDSRDVATTIPLESDDPSKVAAEQSPSDPATAPIPAAPYEPEPTTVPATASIAAATTPMTTARELDFRRKEAREKASSTPTKDSTTSPPATDGDKPPKSQSQLRQQSPKLVRIPKRISKYTAVRTIEWLRQQNPEHYTIQLIGLSTKERMMDFIEKHRLDSRAAWFETVNRGKEWFVVVYGIYTTREAARAGIRTLPRTLRKNKPWAVTVDSILNKATMSG
uniref:Cell division protein DamX, binds to the septal ring, contains C-terminal SPOR domain n=1 Tax=Candidatus Kentrum eta TaxID=2126337 RepID=A0A450UV72_9GAMM|nr:MAG: Cell division protein DamX, binds to the septal ring, contains C-terminal SPOR domain [Candidatus Kentron sp. H]VFJ89964.1 MAG: Cell division protein DamX, binds to the septal ring, contains C-terminal SPOR domain [Candidatus Kentron sp. H]VFJ96340.1 MAG: Cell division protein DamX, binds to the septal ring, contains C-terminal SPOR domain [Candidatus Kentron sp. H]